MAQTIYSDLFQYDKVVVSDLVVDIESIYQSLNNLFRTHKRERLFNIDYGIEWENYLFEPIDELTSFGLFALINDAITQWEPRVFILNSESYVIPDPDNNQYNIQLKFKIAKFEDRFDFARNVESQFGK